MHAALDSVQSAVVLDPDDTFAMAVHGLVLWVLCRDDEAISKLEQAIQLNPNDAEVLRWTGFIFGQQRRLNEGVNYIREAIRLNPFNTHWDKSLGISLYQCGRYEEAVDVLKKYAATDYKWTIAHLAAAYAKLGHVNEARPLAGRSEAYGIFFDGLRKAGLT